MMQSLPASSKTSIRVPVVMTTDVVVVGSSSSAVAAALEAKAQGSSVFAVSDRNYFGSESAGTLSLRPGGDAPGDSLFTAMFPKGSAAFSSPSNIKRALEQSLLQAQIPFWFRTRPVALLKDGADAVAGLVLASRTSLYVVRCRSVVDASEHGLVLQLAGQPFPGLRPAPRHASLVALAEELPKSWHDHAELLEPTLGLHDRKGEALNIRSYRLTLECPQMIDDSVRTWASLEHRLRSQVLDHRFRVSADLLDLPARKVLAPESQWLDDPLAAFDAWNPSPEGLVPCSNLLPVTAKGVAQLKEPAMQLALGRRAGAKAAHSAQSKLKSKAQPQDDLRVLTGSATGSTSPAKGEHVGFASSFIRDNNGVALDLNFAAFPDLGDCDVTVAGGGTGGAPAGIAAARYHARTIVLEMLHGLGGVGTLGLIASYYFGNKVGFTSEVIQAMRELDPDHPTSDSGPWSPELKMSWFHRALLDAGGEAWLGSFAFGVVQKGQQVTGLLVSTPYGMGLLRTGAVVDATGNADVAAAAGAPCRVLDGTHVGVQGTGLSPHQPGERYRNSDYTFIDDCDVTGVTHGFVNARAKFAAEFDVASLVDSRERRQIIGELELSPLDFLAGRTFPDTITTAASNFDTHGFTVHPVFMVLPPDKKSLFAHVPFRCLLPQNVEGVLVTGLGISAHRDAIPVVRMQPDVQNQGYAAGLAATMAATRRCSLRSLDLREIQRELVAQKILAPEVPQHEDSFPLDQATLREAITAGPHSFFNAAVLFSHPEAVRLPLLKQLEEETDPAKRLGYALVLGLMGEAAAAPWLAQAIQESDWDEGWNFRGMGQYGRSMSLLDAHIIALARTESPLAVEPILEKIQALGPDAELSHCRAVAIAAGLLHEPRITAALAKLLRQPGVRGHAHLTTSDVVAHVNDDLCETDARTLSLRELHLAKGLYLAGDQQDLGKTILETYARDLRGHYVRHAQAVLATHDRLALARQSA